MFREIGKEIGKAIVRKNRGNIEKMGQRKDAHTLNAIVPLAKMFGYATDLRSITQGRAVFHMEFSSFKEVPNSVREEIIEKVHGKAS